MKKQIHFGMMNVTDIELKLIDLRADLEHLVTRIKREAKEGLAASSDNISVCVNEGRLTFVMMPKTLWAEVEDEVEYLNEMLKQGREIRDLKKGEKA